MFELERYVFSLVLDCLDFFICVESSIIGLKYVAGSTINYSFGTAMLLMAIMFFPSFSTPRWIKITLLSLSTLTAFFIF